ncbi:MAG: pyridoxamine kinase [Lachnospiraceae bacterium]|nr:pyridoxamine kinase [Lachnospiraceae bacterium]
MIQNETNANDSIPRLAMINSFAGFGRCSTTIALPVISAMQIQVCPIPTAILSNHLAFSTCHYNDYTPYMRSYIQVWKELGFTFDGLYCGFMGNMEQIAIAEEFVTHFKPSMFLLDPVMGDNGKMYSAITEEYCEKLKSLLPLATILTPNITEACLLTNTPYKKGRWTDYELQILCDKLASLCPGHIVITGLNHNSSFMNYIWQNGIRSTYTVPAAGSLRHGTGDLFASILAADALHQVDLQASVRKAADFVALCLRGSDKIATPTIEGVAFEKYLHYLICE